MTDRGDIEQMIARMALGDRNAFAQLYDAVSAKLFAVALRVLKDRGEAEDVLQEVFVKIWRNAGRYDANGLSPMTWLITIARNSAIDKLRKRGAATASDTGVLEDTLPDPAPGPEALAIRAAGCEALIGCFGELDADKAAAVRGAYLEGLSYAELAEAHDVPLNTMRTWLRRSLLKLRECLSR